jgi:hypothetical protein
VFFLLHFLFLLVCQPAPAEAQEPFDSKKKSSPVEESAGGFLPSAGGGLDSSASFISSGETYSLPASPGVPPADIIEQVAWSATGGNVGCEADCIHANDHILSLSRFDPDLPLQIELYDPESEGEGEIFTVATFLAEIQVRTDENGEFKLTLDRDIRGMPVIVLDQYGQEIVRRPSNLRDFAELNEHAGCLGAPPQRLIINAKAQVCTAGDSVKLRSGPSKGTTVLKSLVPGAELTVLGGAECADDWSWWAR